MPPGGKSMLKLNQMIGVSALALIAAACSQGDVKSSSNETPAATAENGQGHTGVVQGVVKDASGQPVAGAFVKLKNAERRLTIMVISQEGGKYTADRLPAGNWTVQSVGGDFESAWTDPAAVPITGGAKADLALGSKRAPDLAAAWPRRVSEDTASLDALPAGHAKDVIAQRCTSCHDTARIAANRADRDGWQGIIDGMRVNMKGANLPPLSDDDAAAILDYTSKNLPSLGEPDPNSRLPRDPVEEGPGRNYRVVESHP